MTCAIFGAKKGKIILPKHAILYSLHKLLNQKSSEH